jgi:hypothetical protein
MRSNGMICLSEVILPEKHGGRFKLCGWSAYVERFQSRADRYAPILVPINRGENTGMFCCLGKILPLSASEF